MNPQNRVGLTGAELEEAGRVARGSEEREARSGCVCAGQIKTGGIEIWLIKRF